MAKCAMIKNWESKTLPSIYAKQSNIKVTLSMNTPAAAIKKKLKVVRKSVTEMMQQKDCISCILDQVLGAVLTSWEILGKSLNPLL